MSAPSPSADPIVLHQLDVFSQWPHLWRQDDGQVCVESFEDDILVLKPKDARLKGPQRKGFCLSVGAIIHGNEVGGLAAVNSVIRQILAGSLLLPGRVAFFLGNRPAAMQSKRFLESDLNRSFGRDHHQSWEQKRALRLQEILADSELFLDLHQTTEVCDSPFFIFPFSPSGYWMARSIAPQVPIVTRWDGSFSKEGQCSDEYVLDQDGVAITIELSQNGLSPYAVSLGAQCIAQCLRIASQGFAQGARVKLNDWSDDAEVYTWAEVIDYPAEGKVTVVEGLRNFSYVEAGQKIADHNQKEIRVSEAGYAMFPQYWRDPSRPRPGELIRVLAPIDRQELHRRI